MSRVERFVFRVGDLQRADLKALRDGYLVVVALVVVAVQLAAARGVARGVGAVVVGAERPVACEDKSGSWFSQQRVVGASKCLARKRQGVSVPSTEAETVIYRTSPAARASGRPPFRSCRDGLAQCEASSLADRRLQPAGAAAPAAAARARPSSSTEPGAWPARVRAARSRPPAGARKVTAVRRYHGRGKQAQAPAIIPHQIPTNKSGLSRDDRVIEEVPAGSDPAVCCAPQRGTDRPRPAWPWRARGTRSLINYVGV